MLIGLLHSPGLAAATNWAFNFALAYFVAPAFKNIQWYEI